MRTSVLCCAAFGLTLLASSSAYACDPVLTECLPAVVVFPAFTPEGVRVGAVEARVRQPIPFERSRFTGLPITVVYNDPTRLPGSVDPFVELVPLTHTRTAVVRLHVRRTVARVRRSRCAPVRA